MREAFRTRFGELSPLLLPVGRNAERDERLKDRFWSLYVHGGVNWRGESERSLMVVLIGSVGRSEAH